MSTDPNATPDEGTETVTETETTETTTTEEPTLPGTDVPSTDAPAEAPSTSDVGEAITTRSAPTMGTRPRRRGHFAA